MPADEERNSKPGVGNTGATEEVAQARQAVEVMLAALEARLDELEPTLDESQRADLAGTRNELRVFREALARTDIAGCAAILDRLEASAFPQSVGRPSK